MKDESVYMVVVVVVCFWSDSGIIGAGLLFDSRLILVLRVESLTGAVPQRSRYQSERRESHSMSMAELRLSGF